MTQPTNEARAEIAERLDELRGRGWSVAVHNDYRLNGQSMTFWLFTSESTGRFAKGEGHTDQDALDQVLASIAPSPAAADAGEVRKLYTIACAWCGKDIATKVTREDGLRLSQLHMGNCPEQQEAARRLLDAPPGPTDARIEKLQAFKNWVHAYLDEHGVPHHPPGVHGAEGCRIGDRMDWLMERLRKAEGDAPPRVGERMREALKESRRVLNAVWDRYREAGAVRRDFGINLHDSIEAAVRQATAALAAPAPAEAATAKAGEWISVKERLPEGDRGKARVWSINGIPAGLGNGNVDWVERHGYTHWLDLPDPPALAASAPAGGVATGEGGE
jgi:hypothetical protein